MAAPDEPAVDDAAEPEEAPPSIAERLQKFMHDVCDEHDLLGQPAVFDFGPLAEAVLRDFFRVDVDAQSIYAVPGVDTETLEGFSMVHWGPMAGRLRPDELRAIGAAFLETAEASEFDSAMVRWLLRDPGASREGVAKILGSFRQFRAELDVADPEPLEAPE
jgi:hypothetical protein